MWVTCYRKVVIQNVVLKTDNVEYLLERYHSLSLNRYYDAELPPISVRGSHFGPNLKAFISVLYFSCEKWGFMRTDIMREFPFPEDDLRTYVPESLIWRPIGKNTKRVSSMTRYVFIIRSAWAYARRSTGDVSPGMSSRESLLPERRIAIMVYVCTARISEVSG
jgi:hypothetical protein